MEGHAWIEVEGEVVGENSLAVREFAPLEMAGAELRFGH